MKLIIWSVDKIVWFFMNGIVNSSDQSQTKKPRNRSPFWTWGRVEQLHESWAIESKINKNWKVCQYSVLLKINYKVDRVNLFLKSQLLLHFAFSRYLIYKSQMINIVMKTRELFENWDFDSRNEFANIPGKASITVDENK